jgi:hypothetical protein
MSIYGIYRTDIQPKGFKVMEFGDYVTEDTVRQAHTVLNDVDLVAAMVEHNYTVARRHYSYATLEKRLVALISQCLGD